MENKDIRIIINLYWNQSAFVREGAKTEATEILHGVRQGCILSPLLFNIYSKQIFKESCEETECGILINENRINNIRYADNSVVCADSLEDLQETMTKITQQYSLDMNINKTKCVLSVNTE